MKFLQNPQVLLTMGILASLFASFYCSFKYASIPFCMLLVAFCVCAVYLKSIGKINATHKTLKKWLETQQPDIDSLFCLFISIHIQGSLYCCSALQDLETICQQCKQELMQYFCAQNVLKLSDNEFIVLRNFPGNAAFEGLEKSDYQTIVCQTVCDRLKRQLASSDRIIDIRAGCAASGIRYRPDTLEQLVDLAFMTEQEACTRRVPFLVADESIRARKLDIEECRIGFMEDDWQKELLPYFQPIIDPESYTVIGAESLARWQLGGFRVLDAHVFKDIACDMQKITTIDQVIIQKTCTSTREMMLEKIVPYTFKIVLNISDESLHKGFSSQMDFMAKKFGLSPSQIEFDIRDSALSQRLATSTIRELREHGFKISLDAFEQSSFDLKAFARADFDSIKLNFSGYTPILEEVYAALCHAARRQNIAVHAKGIENKEMFLAAISLGCTYMQGNYFTLPIPQSGFELFMQKYRGGLFLDSHLG